MTDVAGAGTTPLMSAIVVHWHGEKELADLVRSWPRDGRFELVVVDNGSAHPLPAGPAEVLRPGRNLGFAGGVNAGVAASRAPLLLILNPDARPHDGALEALLAGFEAHPEAAGLAPRLIGADGRCQSGWQLRPLPSPWRLLLHALFVAARAHAPEPAAGQAVEQPAAAALALRRSVIETLGGLDESFYPAWFEDVDLARRLRDAGQRLLYWPRAVFHHTLGSSVPRLGYGLFLWLYYRNLVRYLGKHHGPFWAGAGRWLVVKGALLRLLALPLRCPRRAAGRGDACRGLIASLVGAASGWRRPRSWARDYRSPG